MINIIIGMLSFFLVYLYYNDCKYLLAIAWTIAGTFNLVVGLWG